MASRILKSAAAAMLVAATIACGKGGETPATPAAAAGAEPPASNQVVVYSPHGQEMLDEFGAAFEAANPGVKFVGRFIPTGQILSQLRIDKAKPTVDVWWGGTSAFFGQAKAEKLLQPYHPSWAAASLAGWHDAEDHWYAQFLQVPAIMFNSGIAKPEEMPKTWDGLLDPKWNGKIIIREPLNSGTMKTIFSGIVWKLGGEAHDPAPGYEFLKKLDAQTRSYIPDPQALYDRVAKSPEGYITLWNLTDALFQAQANGYPFGHKIPEEPVPVSVDPIAIIAGAPHADAARKFYEFVTSKENSIKLASKHFRILARTDIPAEELPAAMASIKFDPMPIDLAAFDRLQVEWMDHWQNSIRNPEK